MLCELHELGNNPVLTWLLLCFLGVLAIAVFSGSVFLQYYVQPTFHQWQRKIAPQFPPASMVRLEILQTLKGLATATMCPAAALYLAQHGLSRGYCGITADHNLLEHLLSFIGIWLVSDIYGESPDTTDWSPRELAQVELQLQIVRHRRGTSRAEWAYHYLGHSYSPLWTQHRSHHVFYNPSPFAVIADDLFDQLVRSAPLVLIPALVPVDIDWLFFTFTILFYGACDVHGLRGHECRTADLVCDEVTLRPRYAESPGTLNYRLWHCASLGLRK